MRSRRSILILAMTAGMEMLAGFALLVGSGILGITTQGYGTIWMMLGSALAGVAAGIIIILVGPGDPWNRIVAVGIGLAAAVVPALVASHNAAAATVTALILGVAYWRGLTLIQDIPIYDDVLGRFGMGFGLFFTGIVVAVARGIVFNGDTWHLLALAGIAYTVLSLVALGTARVESAREPGSGRAVALAVTVQLALLLGLGLAALQVFSFNLFGDAYAATRPVWDSIGAAGYHFLLLIAQPIQGLIDLIRPKPHAHPGPIVQPGGPGVNENSKRIKKQHPHYVDLTFVFVIIIALMAAAIAYVVWRTAPRVPHVRPLRGFTEERRSLWSASALWKSLVGLFRGLFRRGTQTAEQALFRTRRRIFGAYPDDPVRRLYVQLLRRAAAAGLPRDSGATPAEYQRDLAGRWPSGRGHFEALTEAYIERRYGEVELAQEEIIRLRRHWQGVRPLMRLTPALAGPGGAAIESGGAAVPMSWDKRVSAMWRHYRPARSAETDADSRLKSFAIFLGVCLAGPVTFFVVIFILLNILTRI